MIRSRTCCSWAADRRGTKSRLQNECLLPSTVPRAALLGATRQPLTKGMTILYGWPRTDRTRHDLGYPSMFSAWGAFVYRFRRPIAVLAVLSRDRVARRSPRRSTGALSAGGWTDPDSESAAVTDRLDAGLRGRRGHDHRGRSAATAGDDARSAAFQETITGSLDRLVADERVDGAIGWAETQDDRFISTDGTSAYVVVRLDDHRRGRGRPDGGAPRARSTSRPT